MTAGTVTPMISTKRTEKGTRTESEIMSPEDCDSCAVGEIMSPEDCEGCAVGEIMSLED